MKKLLCFLALALVIVSTRNILSAGVPFPAKYQPAKTQPKTPTPETSLRQIGVNRKGYPIYDDSSYQMPLPAQVPNTALENFRRQHRRAVGEETEQDRQESLTIKNLPPQQRIFTLLERGDRSEASKLIKQYPQYLTSQNKQGQTILHVVADTPQYEEPSLESLLKQPNIKAFIDIKDEQDRTPLCHAVQSMQFWQKRAAQETQYQTTKDIYNQNANNYKRVALMLLRAGANSGLCEDQNDQKLIESLKEEMFTPTVNKIIGGGGLPASLIGQYSEFIDYTEADKAADIKWEEERVAKIAEEKAREAAKKAAPPGGKALATDTTLSLDVDQPE